MSGRSIAARLRRDIVAALLLSSLVTFAGLYLIGRAQRIHAFEQALQDDLRAISNITQSFPGDDVYVNIQPDALPDFQAGGSRFFQLWDAKSLALLDHSPSLDALKFRFERPHPVATEPRRFEARLPDGREVSLIVVQFLSTWGLEEDLLQRTGQTINDHDVHLLVGRTRQELDASLWPLAAACAAGALILPLLAATVLALRVPHAMRPLNELGREIELRNPDDVRPFDASEVREVQPFVLRLNELMQRIADARHRERQFLAHAAHELRTPLAELHATADVALLRPDDPTNRHAEALEDMRTVTRRAARLVDALFRLARHGREGPKALHPTRLGELIAQAVNQATAASLQRELEWQLEGPEDACAMADPVLLRALLDNLVGNAIAHARAKTMVLVRWHGGDTAGVELFNLCESVPAQPGAGEHLGHGLTVAQLYALAMSATLETLEEGEQFTVRISFASALPN